MNEVMYKMFEQLRNINDELVDQLKLQQYKKGEIQNLEKILLHEDDYSFMLK